MNEYTIHRRSAVFACLPSVKKGGWLGERYFVNLFLLLFIVCGWMNFGARATANTDLLFVPIGDAIMKAKVGDAISAVGSVVIKYSIKISLRPFLIGAAHLYASL